ncbi:MAG TPA: hypothetical protein VM689_20720 [Aliidongia sp.]|nr:hypothetical protein [Aliidongia sp.]
MFVPVLTRVAIVSAMLALAACANVATPAQMAAANYEYSYQVGG